MYEIIIYLIFTIDSQLLEVLPYILGAKKKNLVFQMANNVCFGKIAGHATLLLFVLL